MAGKVAKIFSFLEEKLPKLKGKVIPNLKYTNTATSGSGDKVESWLLEKLQGFKHRPYKAVCQVG